MMRSKPVHYLMQIIVIALGVSLAGCAALTGGDSDNRIEGTVWYKERMLLPPDAQVEVILEDVSKAGAPATSIASKRLGTKEMPPWDFVLTYDSEVIQDSHRYNLRARITHDDQLIFVSKEAKPVFTGDDGSNNHRILVSQIDANVAVSTSSPPASPINLTGISWQLSWIDGDDVDTSAATKPLNMVFVEDSGRAHGYSGCNSFMGRYHHSGKQLTFDAVAATSMACAHGMDREHTFLKSLDKTTDLKIRKGVLTLLDKDGDKLLQFKAGSTL